MNAKYSQKIDEYLESKIESGMYSEESFPYYKWDKKSDDWEKNNPGTKKFKTSLYYNSGEISFEIFSNNMDICLSWDCDIAIINWINKSLGINIPNDLLIEWMMQATCCKGRIKLE